MNIFKIVVLALSALALFYASSSRLFNPTNAVFLQSFFENPETNLDIPSDLINEIRGVGTVLLLGGIVALLGAIRPAFRQTSFVVMTVIFGGIVLGRSVSLVMDGMPNQNLLRVTVIESVFGALNIFCLVNNWFQNGKTQKKNSLT